MHIRTQALVAAALLAAAAPMAPGQPAPSQAPAQPPTFKVEVNYVEIDATVTDAQGKFVNDLTREDFQVVEEGTTQSITAFSRVELPVERADPRSEERRVGKECRSRRAPYRE